MRKGSFVRLKRHELLLPGMRVGLMGGSFNPAHKGHRQVADEALKRLGLDRLWWLVSPQNPLKPKAGMAPFAQRLEGARAMARDPRIVVTDIEQRLGTRYSADLVEALTERFGDVRFIWLMGADNLVEFTRWKDWEKIPSLMPVAVYPRPGYGLKARLSKAARVLEPWLVGESDLKDLPERFPPALGFLHGPLNPLSATALRSGSEAPQ